MKKILSLLIVALVATNSLFADDVSVEQALQIASQFAKSSFAQKIRTRRAPMKDIMPQLAYAVKSNVADKDNVYIVNLGNDEGFVVVSGESGTMEEVLGYCDHGSFAFNNCPIQLKDLLNSYSESIDSLRQNPKLSIRRAAEVVPSYMGTVIVPPLLTTQWSQWGPYNNLCPKDCPTGCVPTAVAQIMKYWKWPDVTREEVFGEDFSGHTYDWDNMLDNYETTPYNSEQALAVAQLMADVGKALGTVYTPEASGTSTDFMPLFTNFKYDADFKAYSDNLPEVMKAELNQSRPLLYSARPDYGDGNGHELVVDGYTSNDYFHFNYGWGGLCDGFYKSALIYSVLPSVVVGIHPGETEIIEKDNLKYVLYKNGSAAILDYLGGGMGEENGEIEIPATIESNGSTYKVTRIYQRAFYNKGRFSKMILGENIEVIDHFAFIYSNIDELVIGDKMIEVPEEAFQVTNITKLTIGASIKKIGKKAFYLCPISTVICKSPAFEVDDYAFAQSAGSPDCGEWLGHITKLGKQAFAGCNFRSVPNFALLEEVGSKAFASCTFPEEEFVVPPLLRSIEPDAFWGSPLSFFKVENNPYFLCSPSIQEYLCNNSGTTVLMTVNRRRFLQDMPETVVRLEPRSVRTNITIPGHIVEMDGAFKDMTSLKSLTCLAVVPPEISDDTFNDKIFENDPSLYVPQGTEMLYRNAPGWRRFNRIFDEEEYVPMAPQGLQYNIVLSTTDAETQQRINIPVSEIESMEVSNDGKNYIIKRHGKEDVTTSIAAIDSIAWKSGFLFENAEVFNLDEDHLTVEAQKCQVRFDQTVIDDDVQLCVRNSVLKPNVTEGVTKGLVVDLSLSNGVHELCGTADITIPVPADMKGNVCAAYFNAETGEWEPVYFERDQLTGSVVISTNHLSPYCIFEVVDQYSMNAKLNLFDKIPELYLFNEATKKLFDIISSPDPEWEMAWQYKGEMAFWQSVGLDVIFNAANGIGEAVLKYKPFSEQVEEIVGGMGYLGTAMNILDVARADLKGDNVGVAAGSLNAILNYTSGQMASAIGTPIMSVSMAGAAVIGIALNKFGEMVQQRKVDLYREAYRVYYSKKGDNLTGSKNYRTPTDWYNFFYPVFAEGKMNAKQLNDYIEAQVRLYCNKFWTDENRVYCIDYAKAQGLSTWMWETEALREQICDEYFAELMNGYLVSVFTAIRNHLKVEAQNRYSKALKRVADVVNTEIGLRITDSSWKEGEKSRYEGWTIRFSEIPASLSDTEKWEKTLNEKGRAGIGWLTEYSLIVNDIDTRLTLIDPKGKKVADYPFKIANRKGKQIIDIDLVSGGVDLENPDLEGLELEYDPNCIEYLYPDYKEEWKEHGMFPITRIYLDNSRNKRARFQTEIEKFFNTHDFITVDASGHIKIGDNIVGEFENNGNEGSGKFTLNTKYNFKEQTIGEIVKFCNTDFDVSEVLRPLDGIIEHKIECAFTITRKSPESKEYDITYTGEGTYNIQARVIKRITNWILDAWLTEQPQKISADNVETIQMDGEGKVKLKYSVKL